MKRLWTLLGALLSLAACASIGPAFDVSAQEKIVRGQTNREQIRAWLGPPHATTKANDASARCPQAWHYAHAEATPGGRTQSDVVVIEFESAGIVCAVQWTKTR